MMRTLTGLLVPLLFFGCAEGTDDEAFEGTRLEGSFEAAAPAPRPVLTDAEAERLYQTVEAAIDPEGVYRTVRYIEFDWVLWNGAEVLRRSHRYAPWAGTFRVETALDGRNLVAVGDWNSALPTRVWMDGEEITGDSAQVLRDRAEQMFELDANALLLPFRWGDLGVVPTHRGTEMVADTIMAEVAELTFTGTAAEPKILFWIDSDTGLPVQTAEYRRDSDPEPSRVLNWLDWMDVGGLMLSTRRTTEGSAQIRFENIRVETTVPEDRFGGPTERRDDG